MNNRSRRPLPSLASRRSVATAIFVSSAFAAAGIARAAIISGDVLELAVAPPDETAYTAENQFDVFGAEQITYDDNVYRLPSGLVNITTLPGIAANAARQDHIYTTSAGLDGQWNIGRQTVVLDAEVDDNRFKANSNLDNISSKDKLVWDWSIGGVLSGQLGATYNRGLINFLNTSSYAKNVYETLNYFGAARYQMGPRWAIFGGVLDSATTLTDVRTTLNDNHARTVALGTDYATGEHDTLGLEYRYTDSRYPPNPTTNDDYREDAARFIVNRDLTEKTSVSASVGFLKREYTALAIESFSGDVWRASVQWKPTDKVKMSLEGWRNLQSYVTSQSDYYVATGVRLSPEWAVTEKVTVDVAVGIENQNYRGIGIGIDDISDATRRDKMTTYSTGLKYVPFQFLIVNFDYAYQRRGSNENTFQFDDNEFDLRITGKW